MTGCLYIHITVFIYLHILQLYIYILILPKDRHWGTQQAMFTLRITQTHLAIGTICQFDNDVACRPGHTHMHVYKV